MNDVLVGIGGPLGRIVLLVLYTPSNRTKNVIEHGCILAQGGQFRFEQKKLNGTQLDRTSDETLGLLSSDRFPSALDDIKRYGTRTDNKNHATNRGKVSRPGGAAGVLKVKPAKLHSKLKNIPDLDYKLKS